MKIHDHIPHLDKEQFNILLLIYASHADYQFTDDEKNFILNKFDKIEFEIMYKLFLSLDDFTCLRTIIKYKEKYYPTEESQTEMFDLLKELFSIDGDFSRMEKVFISFFSRIKQL